MSEVQSRPSAPRGRSSARGGRSGFGSRGGRGGRSHTTNGDKVENTPPATIEDDGEVGQLKKLYGSKVGTIKEMFPDWTDEDAVFALQETDGDLETTVERITDGSITQWGEVSKGKKDRSRSKAKESVTTTLGETTNTPRTSRGGRAGHEGGRGGRGRGTDRGRGGRGRGAATAHTNGTRSKEASELSVPTEDSTVWHTPSKKNEAHDALEATKPDNTWSGAAVEVASTTAAAAAKITSSVIPEGMKKSWASMFKTVPVPTPASKKEPSTAQKAQVTAIPEPVESEPPQLEPEVAMPQPNPELSFPAEDATPTELPTFQESEPAITPSKDELTEQNVEQVLDTSHPPQTATQASTAASSWDPRSGAGNSTPYSALQQQQRPPPASGHAASALRATGGSGRASSYQRRILDQEEAVRMPGNREVDRAAVQFGAFSLNGTGEEDVDGDREEPETRAQPPQHSPVAHPRASLPPAPAQSSGMSDRIPTPPGLKEATSLPSATHQAAAPGLPSPNNASSAQNMSQQGSQGSQQYNQFGRYGQAGAQEQSTFGQKPYDPFTQQAPTTQSQFEGYPNQQNPSQPQPQPQPQQSQPQSAAFSSAPSEYSSYYTADQQRNAYQNYYGQQYNQPQGAQAQQDGASTSQQRSYSGYNAPQADSTSPFPQSSAQQSQSRYATAGETQTSGHTTPNPPGQNQQPGLTSQGQQAHPSQPQGQPGQYPYGHPYYSSPYYTAYVNQYQQGYGQGNYAGGPYGAKTGMYNQPHQGYGMSPQAPYDHAVSPAVGGFGQSSLHGRDSTLGGALGDYGRAGSQPAQTAQPLGAGGPFGGMQDAFARGSSYQGQGQHYGQQQASTGDDLKPYGDGKSANGPSPLLSQAARPGSAANSAPGQSGLPPPQSSQAGYGGYPSHLQQQHALHGSQTGSQYGGLGGVGGHQAAGQGHQSSQYGGYGQGFSGNSYYGNNQQRGGWGNNYGH